MTHFQPTPGEMPGGEQRVIGAVQHAQAMDRTTRRGLAVLVAAAACAVMLILLGLLVHDGQFDSGDVVAWASLGSLVWGLAGPLVHSLLRGPTTGDR